MCLKIHNFHLFTNKPAAPAGKKYLVNVPKATKETAVAGNRSYIAYFTKNIWKLTIITEMYL